MSERKTISSNPVYIGKYVQVREDQIRQPNGKTATYEIVHKKDFVLVIAQNGGVFYLVHQYRHAVSSESLEFVKGMIDKGEEPLQAAHRELEEELGKKAKSMKLLGKLWTANGSFDQSFYVYLARELSEGKQNLEDTEEGLEVKTATLTQLETLISNGTIKDSPSITAFALYILRANLQ